MKKIECNIGLYYWYKVFFYATMRGPILVTYMTNTCGMSLSEVFFCESCCVIISFLLQVPTGAFADKWGRANAVKIGCCVLLAELICFGLAENRTLIWIGNALWAIGSSFVSGADSSLLYDSLKQSGLKGGELDTRFKEVEGKASSWVYGVTSIMCLVSGYLAEINIRLPILVDVIMNTLAIVVAFFFTETTLHSQTHQKGYFHHMYESVKFVFHKINLIWIISFAVLIGVTSKLWFFTYNPYFEMVRLPIHYYGFIFFALNMVAGISSYYANAWTKRISDKWSIILSILVLTTPMIIMGTLISKWSVSLVIFQNLVRGYMGPFMSNMLHKRIESENRATVLSVKSALYQVAEVICMFFFGLIIHSVSLGTAITLLGITSTILGIILVITYTKIFRNGE